MINLGSNSVVSDRTKTQEPGTIFPAVSVLLLIVGLICCEMFEFGAN